VFVCGFIFHGLCTVVRLYGSLVAAPTPSTTSIFDG